MEEKEGGGGSYDFMLLLLLFIFILIQTYPSRNASCTFWDGIPTSINLVQIEHVFVSISCVEEMTSSNMLLVNNVIKQMRTPLIIIQFWCFGNTHQGHTCFLKKPVLAVKRKRKKRTWSSWEGKTHTDTHQHTLGEHGDYTEGDLEIKPRTISAY